MNGVRAFREALMTSDTLDETNFSDYEARRMRYEIYWSYYEGNAYREFHRWAAMMKAEFGLYKYTRNIYDPAYRLGEFWKSHLFGGNLDPLAGDGDKVPSAIPITTENERLRPAIGQIWNWSNWQINKDTLGLWGAVLGDAALKITDDIARKKVYLSLVHPGTIKSTDLDRYGNVKGYVIEEIRIDPLDTSQTCTYTETAERGEGEQTVFKTYRNGGLFAWNGEVAEWAENYGFIPLVVFQHNNVGLSWGWSEMHPDQSKFREVNDIGSKLSDQIRKMVDAPWLFIGVDDPNKKTGPGTMRTANPPPSTADREPGRQTIPALYGPVGADAKPLVANLDIAATSAHIESLLQQIERDYPELSYEAVISSMDTGGGGTGGASGRALRIRQGPAEIKVRQRRATYDDALVRAQQMALSIAGMRGYEPFQWITPGSYTAGELNHHVGERPVFNKDPLDDLEEQGVFWTNAKTAKDAGMPLTAYLERAGWTPEDIAKVTGNTEYQAQISALEAAATANPPASADFAARSGPQTGSPPPGGSNNPPAQGNAPLPAQGRTGPNSGPMMPTNQ